MRDQVLGPTVSVVVPVYRSESTLKPLIERLTAVLAANSSAHEIILVNDGSPDRSWDVIRELMADHRSIRAIDLTRNFGQHNALLCGIRAARHEVIVTLDADLQHPPEEVPKLLAALEETCDVVYGTPVAPGHGLSRILASQLIRWTMRFVLGIRTAGEISAFRAFRTALRDAFAHYRAPLVSIDALLAWATQRFRSVAVHHALRPDGGSSYSLRRLTGHALDVITGFSTLPLRLASFIGFCLTLGGVAVLVYVVGRYLILGYSVPGFPFLASIIAIFSGAQLFALGIIGEYLARMHFRIMERPAYVVRRMLEPE